MTSITLYNKGKRVWTLINASGAEEQVKPEASIEMEEAAGLRMLVDYPREFTSSKIAGPSSEDLARREQSLKDRTANLDAREAAIKAREDILNGIGPDKIVPPPDLSEDKPKRGPGRPAKVEGAAPEIK
jgi:hypothetical protein